MSERRRYRSLYWRLGLGLVAFLALMLAAQSALFVWMIEQSAGSMPARSPRRVAVIVASDVAGALAEDATLDLNQYLRDHYGHVFQPIVVVMRDGTAVTNYDDIPDRLQDAIGLERARLQAQPRERRRDRRPPAARPPERSWESAPVIVAGEVVGRVAVLGGPPIARMLRELGPTMALVAGGVLLVGGLLIAFVVFGPARRRLRAVESATERLGAGDTSARAPEDGGDEVASVARSFNRMADELADRAQALEAADGTRRQLLADVSHELMTPLTAMRGYVETLRMRELDLDSATRDRYLRIIDEETHRLEAVVGDLLDLAKLQGGGAILHREPLAIAALFDRVRARHERECQARGIRLVTRIAVGAEQVVGDADRLEQALQNLTANALRHSPDGGVVTLSSTVEGDAVHLRVRDTGSGIAEEHLPLIFDRFYKVDSSRRAAGGSGLGLSIVKAIVERHGGSISAHNDDGAVFDIALPRPA